MAQLTEKENFMMMFDGKIPEWIPRLILGPVKDLEAVPATAGIFPGVLMGSRMKQPYKDIWGVEYITTKEAAGAMIPKTWDFILEDITKWRDVIKAPSLEGIDWESACKQDLERFHTDRTQTALSMNVSGGYFQLLMAFMGFTEGLCALFDEPEACHELFEYLADFYCTVIENTIDYYKPDIFNITDDTAAWGNPFVSLDMFREYFLPLYDREAKFARDRGIPISYHNCGKCEIFMEDMYNIGVRSWNPAQICNDLDGIQEKYGNSLILNGCWDVEKVTNPSMSDDDIYEYLLGVANDRAKNGGFCFLATILIPEGEEERMTHVNDVVNKAIIKIGHEFYK
ncbi:MAG: veratrol--corrinoid protein metyltransferase [Lachnospiraceae bacterium]|nr:veratrol--corrinoid protein metyltransferase [Lachnospiraceae bacterium]